MRQLSEIIDTSSLGYEISFIPTTYFVVNKELNAAPYFPTINYLIEGNPESAELYIPSEVFIVTSILRPTKQSVANYLIILSKMRCKKIFFQPFLTNSATLSLYQVQPRGGLIIRVGDVKEYDDFKFVT
jgi:hypothetical protein